MVCFNILHPAEIVSNIVSVPLLKATPHYTEMRYRTDEVLFKVNAAQT